VATNRRLALGIAPALCHSARVTYRYLHLDVFTSTPFEGNQLAVFLEPHGLTPAQMQRIANEMAFSESTFVFPPEGAGDVRMRIFTPGSELPMAGHPTIGTTFALAIEGTIARGRESFIFELGVGPTPVSLEWNANGLSFAWMEQKPPTFGSVITDRGAAAGAVGVSSSDLIPGLPVQVVSCGVPFLFVPLATRAAVDAVAIEHKAMARCFQTAGVDELPVFVFTPDRANATDDATVYSRMLAASFGIAEDPATGGASGPLASYLLHHRVVSRDVATSMISSQGVAMGRPSRIHMSLESDGDRITRVRVGGQSVLVGRGELNV
jgi:trans-2,3-dihydro-3-hydroxyanthranilate isomerase